jgi:3-deoxy-D-manno-octulosonate 8-phosphate phosphatase (KDO 8-P phosphatase)
VVIRARRADGTRIALARGATSLAIDDARARASRITLVLADCDGVLTDTGVYYGEQGEILKRFSIRDGMGVERLRHHGVRTGIVTGEVSPSVHRRAEKLRIEHLYLGIKDKRAALSKVLEETGLGPEQIAYIGDDYNDLGILRALSGHGLVATPADGMPEVVAQVHYRCRARGGHGAFRDFAEWILGLRGIGPETERSSE